MNGGLRSRVLVAGALLSVFAIVVALGGRASVAQDVFPTPDGQLGGAPSLQTAPPAPAESPAPTPADDDEDVPTADECRVRPRTIDDLLTLAATPGAGGGDASATPAALPVGESANPIVASAVGYTVREAVACSNAGEIFQLWSLYSDIFVQDAAAQLGGFDEEFLRGLAGPQPARTDPMPEVLDVRLLPDGRAVARVVPSDDRPIPALSSGTGDLTVVFVLFESRWLIDEVRPDAANP